jgi:hypothetical protein
MPYIKKEDRKKFEPDLFALANKLSIKCNPGDYNYIITQLIHSFISGKGLKYETLNAAIGILECAKLELSRMVVSPYEDKKIEENGAISFLDIKKGK